MTLLDNLALGFQTSLSLINLWYAFLGAMLGTLIGVLPGLGPIATIAMLLPSMYALEPTSARIMLALLMSLRRSRSGTATRRWRRRS